MTDIATLGIAIDATQVTAGATKLDGFTAAGAKAETQTNRITASSKQLATALQQTGGDLQKATALLVAQADAATSNANAQRASATAIADAATATASVWKTTAQSIAESTGLVTSSFRSAQLAALSFGSAAEIVDDAALAINGANLSMAESLGALGGTAVQTARTVAESEAAMGEAAVAGAAVVTGAHGAVSGSSTAVRESLTLVREASVGNFTRMAGSASILLQALGLLGEVLVPLAGLAGTFAAAVAVGTNQINNGANGLGDLTKGLGLTADQLDKVKDKYVTFGDTAKATFQVLWGYIASPDLSKTWQDTWNFIADVATDMLAGIVGSVIGSVNVIEEAWKAMPTALGGAGTTAGIDFSKAFQSGIDSAKTALNKFYSDVSDQAGTNALQRILKEAGNDSGSSDGALTEVDRQIQKLKDQTDAQNKLNDAVDSGTMSVSAATQAQKLYQQISSTVARIETDDNLTQTQKAALIKSVTDAQLARNDAAREWEAIQALDKAGDQNQLLQLQISLIGQGTLAIAKQTAALRAQQEASAKGYDATQAQDYIASQVAIAANQVVLRENQDAYNASLTFTSNYIGVLSKQAQDMASGLEDAFGTVGKAISDMTTAFGNYATQQAKFQEQQTALNKTAASDPLGFGNPDLLKQQILLTQQKQEADTNYYASVLGSAKEFFNQGTAGYKLLQAAETAYRAYELTMSIAGIAQKEAETAAVVTSNAAQTASNATTAVSNAAADVPFPANIAAVATVVALLAGFGILAGGGGGASAAATPVDPAKQLQAENGTGTVLGDATAKSDSIAKSIDQLTKDTNTDLEYSNQMVISLKSIDSQIGSLTNLLAQQLQVGGYFDTSTPGLGDSTSSVLGGLSNIPVVGGILGSLFGSSSTSKTLLDQGIQVAGETIGQAIANGVTASAYQTVQTTTHSSSLFGLISSTHTNTSTTNTALPSDFTDQISSIVDGLRSTVLDAANKLGVQGAQQVIDSLSLNIGSISFKDMTGDQIQDTLNAVFSKLGDQIATAAVPAVTTLQQTGEGALETLSRLVNEYSAVDDAAKTVGFTFSQVGVDSLAARDALVQASGGLDNFTSQANYFISNFLTDAQALAPVQKAVADEMASLGEAGVATKAQFVALVQNLDTSTASGAQLYAALMNVAPAFDKVADAAADLASDKLNLQIKLLQDIGDTTDATNLSRQQELATLDASLVPLQKAVYAAEDLNTANDNLATATTNLTNAEKDFTDKTNAVATAQAALNQLLNPTVDATTALSNAHSDLVSAYNAEAQTLQNTISQFTNFKSSLEQFLQTLTDGDLASNDALRQYAVTRAIFQQTATAAASGDQTAIGNLQQAGEDFLNASKAASQTSTQYNTDLAAVKAATEAAASQAQTQVDVAQAQLDALNASVSGLDIVNNSVLSVKEALQEVATAQAAVDAQHAQDIAAAQAALAAAQADQAVSFDALQKATQAQSDAQTADANAITGALDALHNLVGTSYGTTNQSIANETAVEKALGTAISNSISNLQSTSTSANASLANTFVNTQANLSNDIRTGFSNLLAGFNASVTSLGATLSGQLANIATINAQAQAASAAATKSAQQAAADAAAQNAKTQAIAQATDAFNAAKATADEVMAQRDAVIAQLGPQTDTYVQQNYATGQLGGYMHYYTYTNDAQGQALVKQAQSLNAEYVTDFQKALALYKAIPGHATGLSYVPYDNYLAKLHEGERVLTKTQNEEWNSGKRPANDNSALISEIRAMRNDMSKMNAKIEKNTRDTSKTLKNVTQGGNVLLTKDAS